MKKLTIAITLILALCLTFAACADKKLYDTNECIETLKANGLAVTESSTDEESLKFVNASINNEIYIFQGRFNVEVISYTVLTKMDDLSKTCKVIEMSTEEQANMYCGLFLNKRGEGDGWVGTVEDKTVILTNIAEVPTILNLIFK